MVLVRLAVGYVMDPVEKPLEEVSNPGKKDKEPKLVGGKVDARSKLSA
jgi:hypothetical protein